jgi:pimeloyl-ACP methyl ester carboxylesterase
MIHYKIKDVLAMRTFMLLLILKLIASLSASEWVAHKVCGQHEQLNQNYCLELWEFTNQDSKATPVLLIPGIFQNKWAFDLIAENNISLVRYLKKKFNIKLFVLHPQGIGESDFFPDNSIDQMAMEDIHLAVDFLYQHFNDKITIIAHSMGAMALQGFLAGLNSQDQDFDQFIALKRQKKVKAVGLIAGSLNFEFKKNNIFLHLAQMASRDPLYQLIGAVNLWQLEQITTLLSPFHYLRLKHPRNEHPLVTKKARQQAWARAMESVSGKTLQQLINAVNQKSLMTNFNQSYIKALPFIKTPIYQLCFELDQLSPPENTRNAFNHLGSIEKIFEISKGVGHRDYYMSHELHHRVDNMMDFLLQ